MRRHVTVKGCVQPGFECVRDEFEASFREGREAAAQLTVYHRGRLVVDLWGGEIVVHDEDQALIGARVSEDAVPIRGEDIGVIFSCTKVAESLVMAMLVDRGLLDFKAPIATYWPEFAVNGKESITVQQLMRHQSGLSAVDELIPLDEILDEDKSRLSARLAEHKLNFNQAEVRQLYHAVTRGFYASEIVRRVDPQKRTLGRFFREEVAQPLNLPFYIGLTSDERAQNRIIRLVKTPVKMLLKRLPQYLARSKGMRTMIAGGDSHDTLEDWEAAVVRGGLWRALCFDMELNRLMIRSGLAITGINSIYTLDQPHVHAAEIPSAGGLANARSMARLASLIATKAGPEHPLFQNECARQQALESSQVLLDEILNMQLAYTSAGWGVDRFLPGFVGWAGAGDAVMQWSEELDVGFGYLPSMPYSRTHKPRGVRLMRATVQAVRALQRSKL